MGLEYADHLRVSSRRLNVHTGRTVTIPAQIVRQLIALGHLRPDAMDEADLAPFMDDDWINRTGRDLWEAALGPLATQDVVAVIKGLVVTEHRLGWMGGSVSGAIWIFHELQRRDPLLAKEVADWVLSRTRNPYVPFGRQNHGAKSLKELERLEGEYAARHQARRECHSTEQAALAANAARRREDRARSNGLHAQRHALAAQLRRQLIDRVAPLSPAARLDAVVSDVARPVDFYPKAWATLSPEDIASLSAHTRDELLMRLPDRRKGPWRALYLALQSAGGTHSKRAE